MLLCGTTAARVELGVKNGTGRQTRFTTQPSLLMGGQGGSAAAGSGSGRGSGEPSAVAGGAVGTVGERVDRGVLALEAVGFLGLGVADLRGVKWARSAPPSALALVRSSGGACRSPTDVSRPVSSEGMNQQRLCPRQGFQSSESQGRLRAGGRLPEAVLVRVARIARRPLATCGDGGTLEVRAAGLLLMGRLVLLGQAHVPAARPKSRKVLLIEPVFMAKSSQSWVCVGGATGYRGRGAGCPVRCLRTAEATTLALPLDPQTEVVNLPTWTSLDPYCPQTASFGRPNQRFLWHPSWRRARRP